MASFSELLKQHIQRIGISDTELARGIGVRRQTIFRWKEGTVERPRNRDDVLACADKLRLSPREQDELLVAAGFAPEDGDKTLAEPRLTATVRLGSPDEDAPTDMPPTLDDAGAAKSATVAAVPRLVWGVVVALFAGVIALAMGWLRLSPPPVPSPTAVPSVVAIAAKPGETLVLVAQFANYTTANGYNVAGRVREAIQNEVNNAKLEKTVVTVWPEEISDGRRATEILLDSGASVVVWGEYDSGRVRVNLSTPEESSKWERLLPSPDELSATINVDVPQEIRSLANLALGRLYRTNGQVANARAAFGRALEQVSDPTLRATAQFYLATVLQRGQDTDLDKAIALYSQVIDAKPQWVNARYNRGSARLDHYYTLAGSKADLNAALDDLSWVISRRRDFADAYLNRGIAYYERREVDDTVRALDHISRAVELNPDNATYFFNRGLVHVRAGHDEPAAADFQAALARDPAYGPAYNGLCWGYALANQPEQALVNCDRALELEQGDLVRDGRGIANALAGRYDAAVVDLSAYLAWVKTLPPSVYARYRGPQVEEWIAALERGDNPFDAATLAALR